MFSLLHIDASARSERSITRQLSSRFIKIWQGIRPLDHVVHRDLGRDPPSFVSEQWIEACFISEEDRTKSQKSQLIESDELIAELEQADCIVLGTPMYNYGMPAALKAWIDQVIRIDKTFTFDPARGDFPLDPILSDKILVCLTSKGEFGFAQGGIRNKMNHLDGHIETLSSYLGAKENYFVHVEYQEFDDDRHRRSRVKADCNTVALAETLARGAQSREACT